MNTLMTVGYEGWSLEPFFNKLTNNQVQTLIDVRELPISRKKGFAKTALSNAALEHGIEYRHIRSLGCPRTIRYDYRAHGDWKQFVQSYLDYLHTQETAIFELIDLIHAKRCCLLCVESNPNVCHRILIVKRIRTLLNHSLFVVHLSQEPNAVDA